jgi:hypothetical protein
MVESFREVLYQKTWGKSNPAVAKVSPPPNLGCIIKESLYNGRMKSLFIDASGRRLVLCFHDESRWAEERFPPPAPAPKRPSSVRASSPADKIFPALAKLLGRTRPQELDLVVVARGPGTFSGVRAGLAIAKGFAAAGIKVVGVDNFKALWLSGARGRIGIAASPGEEFSAVLGDDGGFIEPPSLRGAPAPPEYFLDPVAVLSYFEENPSRGDALDPLYVRPHYAKKPGKD